MKKALLLSASVLLLQSCNSATQEFVPLEENTVQQLAVNKANLDHPDFVRKMKNPKTYKVNLKPTPTNSLCGANDLQQVNSYDGKLGPSVEFVKTFEKAVGAMESEGKDTSSKFCTGTLIGENLFITAAHCVDGSTKGKFVAFNYQKAKNSSELLPQKHFKIAEVIEDGLSGLDYAVLKLDGQPGKEFGITKLNPKGAQNGDALTIIQHPKGQPKQIEAGLMEGLEGSYMTYDDIDTEPGSSGSGVLNKDGEIVGIHTNGGCGYGGGANRGVSMPQIYKASKILPTVYVQNLDI